nr:hypothetical protein [Enterobacter mori]
MSKIEALKLAISRTKHGVMRINDVVRDVNATWEEAGEPYPLPVGEHKRRTWLLADLERMLTQLVDEAHAEALTEDKRFNWLANRCGLFHASIKWVQVEMLNAAHSEALRIDAEQYAAPVTCSIFQRNDGVQLALDSSCDVRFIRTSKNGEWFKAGFRNTNMEGYQPVESDVLFTCMPSRTLSYSDGVIVVSEA